MGTWVDLKGERFGRLLVIRPVGRNRFGSILWQCECDCGGGATCLSGNLRKGISNSCGCAKREACAKRLRTHGLSDTPEYWIWQGIKRRCEDPSRDDYPRYGGRGIFMCARWRDSVEAFVADMGARPSPQHSVERKDNDGPYSLENCILATAEVQQNNRRSNRLLTLDGVTKSMTQWARERGVPYYTLKSRLNRGVALRQALGMGE